MSLLIGSGLIVILCVLLLSLGFNLSELQEKVCFLLSLAAIMLGCLALIGLSLFIKCPQCNLRWFWYAIAKDCKHNVMIGHLAHCQRCNFPERL